MKFNNVENECVKTVDGRTVWLSRSMAVCNTIMVKHEDRTYVLMVKRGPGCPDEIGSREANIALSRIRAQAVVNYLIREQGMDPNRFVVVGNGPDSPVCNEDTPACYAKNRRTDFQILGQ